MPNRHDHKLPLQSSNQLSDILSDPRSFRQPAHHKSIMMGEEMITDNEQLASASECQCGSEALERYACKATQNIMIHGAECCTIAELVGLETRCS